MIEVVNEVLRLVVAYMLGVVTVLTLWNMARER